MSMILGAGSPILDLVAEVDEEFLDAAGGEKGGMELVDSAEMGRLLGLLATEPRKAIGGSAANTVFALSRLGIPTSFLGKLGGDAEGAFYMNAFRSVGGDAKRFTFSHDAPTARCLSLVTPDAERTMRTDLGAAGDLSPEDVSPGDFAGCGHLHMEGYLLFNPALAETILSAAAAAGCTVSLDLGSFEVVRAAGDTLADLLERYVDMVFANEEEAEEFCGSSDPDTAAEALTVPCETAALKLGANGAVIVGEGEKCSVEAVTVDDPVDTTGAGDYWAAGFLYGIHAGRTLAESGRFGAILGAEVVKVLGAELSDKTWGDMQKKLAVD